VLKGLIGECEGSVFDPGKREVTEFLVNLHSLLEEGDRRVGGEAILWQVISVLLELSKSPSARVLLTRTFDFTPLLTDILSAQEDTDNKLKLLYLLQVTSSISHLATPK
jgi:hypothetical protein